MKNFINELVHIVTTSKTTELILEVIDTILSVAIMIVLLVGIYLMGIVLGLPM